LEKFGKIEIAADLLRKVKNTYKRLQIALKQIRGGQH
jgi:hypothetical protein